MILLCQGYRGQESTRGMKGITTGGFAAVWVLIAVVAVVFSGAAVFAMKNLNKNRPLRNQTAQVQEQDTLLHALQTLSDSDELAAIEQDINNTQLDDIDKELSQVDQDLTGIQ